LSHRSLIRQISDHGRVYLLVIIYTRTVRLIIHERERR